MKRSVTRISSVLVTVATAVALAVVPAGAAVAGPGVSGDSGGSVASGPSGLSARSGPPGPPGGFALRDLAVRARVGVGTAVDMNALAADAPYRAAVAREFSTVTAENVMKWQVLEPEQGRYDFAPADELMRFAKANHQRVRGHVLVWHSQLPAWLTEDAFTPAQLRDLLRRHITTVVSRYKGRIFQWDVVNEAFNEDGTLRDTIWLRALGPGYIADAFRWAHAADPRAKLFYNDFNIENVGPKSDAVFAMVRRLKAQGVPIHGVGMQGHETVSTRLDSMRRNLARFDAMGVRTAVTEADVRIPLPADDAELKAQAELFGTMLRACLDTRRCDSFTVWGFTDRYSWVPGVFPGEGAATILDENLTPKPAYTTLATELRTGR